MEGGDPSVSAWRGSLLNVGIRISNARFDGIITGWVLGPPTLKFADPGGMISASFKVEYQIGVRSDIFMPYSRVYFFDKATGEIVFEGDMQHPGRASGDGGFSLDIIVKGGVDRLSDWSGPRIWVDRDMTAWIKTSNSVVATNVQPVEDRGGSGNDSLTLAFPSDQHVETNSRCEAGYYRIRESGQELGWFNYSWDGGHTSGSPGWLVRSIATPPSTVVRSEILSVSGSGGSGAIVGGSLPTGSNVVFLQLIWTSGSSNTGSAGADIVWASIMTLVVICRLKNKTGAFQPGSIPPYNDYLTAQYVVEDMLGTELLINDFDGANSIVDNGAGYGIRQLAYPDGVTPRQVFDELMKYEQDMTYLVGPSNPANGKYHIDWIQRSETIRYQFYVWIDQYEAGAQEVDQYDVAIARWRSPTGIIKQTVTTQSIPEMTAVGRSRRIYQDLSDTTSDSNNAAQANSILLNDHRFPTNGGKITVSREVVDMWTGRRVAPHQIKPGYVANIVGINPHRDALNSSPRNGSTICRIMANDYDTASNSASLDLDSEPWSMFKAIARANKRDRPLQRRSY
jgi:hypothetical protein